MRLTLRTMLAYMDDILEPADAQDIAKKLEESKFASDLMHRTRDVTRRLRLGAPKLEGRGMGLDPNTVAEYLDNTLPSERVADFEKVCLESDVHLAEVASAHQILALVLGEPAELDEKSRVRMYGLISLPPPAAEAPLPPPAVPQPPAAPAPAKTAAPSEPADAKPRSKLEVPDYLRDAPKPRSRSRVLMVAAALLLLVGIIGVVNARRINEILAILQGNAAQNGDNQPQSGNAPTTPEVKHPESGAVAPPATSGQAPPPRANNETKPPIQLTQPNITPLPPVSPPGNPPPPAPLPSDKPIPGAPMNTTPGTAPATVGPPTTTPATQNPPAGAPAATQPAPLQPLPGAPPTLIPPTGTPPVTPAVTPAVTPMPTTLPPDPARKTTEPPAVTPEGLGRLVSEHELLLRYDVQSQKWRRLTARAILFAGDKLLCLPTYHANLGLSVGVNVEMLGGTTIELMTPDARGVPGIRLTQGRLKVFTVGRPEAQVRLALVDRQGTVGFGDADSTLAIEARRLRTEGVDPEKEPAILELDMYATGGQIAWSDLSSARPQLLSAPTLLTLTPGGELPAAPGMALPPWIKADEVTPTQKRGSVVLEEALTADRPISLGLKELAADRRSEVNSLAVQCLAQIGEFDSFPPLLGDETRRANWEDQLAALRSAIALSPQTAANVKKAFVNDDGEQKGLELYRMLWGYTPADLQAGAAAQLVKYLDHEDLDIRVVSFSALVRITGQTHFYRPEYTPAAKRAQYVARWKQRLDAPGGLVPKAGTTPPPR